MYRRSCHRISAIAFTRTVIPRNVRLAEAPSLGMPVLAYDAASRGAIAYLAAASEMLGRHGKQSTVAAPESTAAVAGD